MRIFKRAASFVAETRLYRGGDTDRCRGGAEENEGGLGRRPTAHHGTATENPTARGHAVYLARDQRHGSSEVPAMRQLLLLQRPVGRHLATA